ncbi:MAG TPA: YggS family pyridoxal phosphate-dependent enzyme [Actinobacteria bacterium]|nr:YggS family pyridoxal phosphate-dependent enzyme [Actinomycetota bacterium]
MTEKNNKKILQEKYKNNIDGLKKKIGQICKNIGRNPREITIIAATKYADAKSVDIIRELGIMDLGENRADELTRKSMYVDKEARWHFIGHLQSRKARDVVPIVEYIHSIDSIRILEKVSSEAKKNSKIQKVLIEVNISGEESRYGLGIDNVVDFIIKAEKIDNIELKGLMTMAPYTDDMEYIRKIFKRLRLLKEKVGSQLFSELSMGMSNDFSIAIEEGATMIRIGSTIFK